MQLPVTQEAIMYLHQKKIRCLSNITR